MNPATKKAALAKLGKIAGKIGYPDHWRDYSSLRIIRGDALGNAYRSSEFELQRQLSKIGKPVNRTEWSVSGSVPDAFYDPQLNAITFAASVIRPARRRCSKFRRHWGHHWPRVDPWLR